MLNIYLKTPPMPVPSPDEKGGGLGVGLATLPRKNPTATETQRKQQLYRIQRANDGRIPMTGSGESPRDPRLRMHDHVFITKTKTRVGTWNVRMLYQAGKLEQLLREIGRYNIDILGMSEMRWTGSGRINSDGMTILHSGHDADHARGVGLVLSARAAAALEGWKPISDRIITTRLLTHHVKTTVVQAYIPTDDADEKRKDDFYRQLECELDGIPRHDLVLLIGDFNAQIGPDRAGSESIIGPHGTAARTNDNGERLRSLCDTANIAIGNTFFEHRRIHKTTWRSPDGHTHNEIDFVCIGR